MKLPRRLPVVASPFLVDMELADSSETAEGLVVVAGGDVERETVMMASGGVEDEGEVNRHRR